MQTCVLVGIASLVQRLSYDHPSRNSARGNEFSLLSVNHEHFLERKKYPTFRVAFFPLQIGDHVFIGEGSVVNAAVVSSYVYIGKNVIIGRRCVLKDCCYIEDNSVVPPETVVPTFTKFSGSPARRTGELPENTQDIMMDFTKSYYSHFTPQLE